MNWSWGMIAQVNYDELVIGAFRYVYKFNYITTSEMINLIITVTVLDRQMREHRSLRYTVYRLLWTWNRGLNNLAKILVFFRNKLIRIQRSIGICTRVVVIGTMQTDFNRLAVIKSLYVMYVFWSSCWPTLPDYFNDVSFRSQVNKRTPGEVPRRMMW